MSAIGFAFSDIFLQMVLDNDNVSLFITESRMIISVMITAIEECKALLQEYEFVEEKWVMLEDLLFGLSVDWNLLEGRMEFPHSNEESKGTTKCSCPKRCHFEESSTPSRDLIFWQILSKP